MDRRAAPGRHGASSSIDAEGTYDEAAYDDTAFAAAAAGRLGVAAAGSAITLNDAAAIATRTARS
jgi:hypothetical protein